MRLTCTEAEFQKQVIALARLYGFKVAHFRPARVLRGGVEKYETPVAADGKGFLDMILIHPKRRLLYVVEAKSEGGRLTPEQRDWISWWEAVGVRVMVWRPAQWEELKRVLEGEE